MWAFDHFRYHRYVSPGIAGMVALAATVLFVKQNERLRLRAARVLAALEKRILLFAFIVWPVFWLFRVQFRSGDSGRLIEQLRLGELFHMSQPLTTLLFWTADRALGNWDADA